MSAARLVFRHPLYLLMALVVSAVMLLLLLWSSQVLVFHGGAVHVEFDPRFVVAAGVIAALVGVLLPMQVYAFRLAAASAAQAGGSALGALLGTASMTCCAPVVLPSILSLLGFSGATILSLNLTAAHFWLPLATLSALLLLYSLVSVASSLQRTCHIPETGAGFIS